jgi:hypothetical protein
MSSMDHYRKYVLIALPLLIIHTTEEYLTNFWNTDGGIQFIGGYLNVAPIMVYTAINVAWFLFLIFLLFRWNTLLLLLFGLMFVLKLDHPVHSLILGSYYSGVVTSIPLIILGFFFWKAFLKEKMII